MEKETLKTRHEEFVFPTSDLKEMSGKYLAANVVREWPETFLDKDTGEAVEVTRTELIMRKGELLTPENVSTINFYIQTGDVKTVTVTNIKRSGEFVEVGKDTIWSIVVTGGGYTKKRKYILFAQSLDQALIIARDYLEQTLVGTFKIEAAKSYSSCIVIPDDNFKKIATDKDGNVVEDENVILPDFYNVQTSVKTKDNTREYTWLLLATSVDDAKARIHKYIDTKIQEAKGESEEWEDYELTVLSGTCASVKCVIPKEFSIAYFKWEEAEEMAKDPNKMLKAIDKAIEKSKGETK